MNNKTIMAIALLLLTNVVVLAGVAYNRSGDPDSSLLLTERELLLPYSSYSRQENSGLALGLRWNVIRTDMFDKNYRRYALSSYGNPIWLTEQKQRELGVDVDNIKKNKEYENYQYKKINSEEIIVVLEYDGESFKKAIKDAENDFKKEQQKISKNTDNKVLKKQVKTYEQSLAELKNSESRLIAIDAGLDLQTLRAKYKDRSKYLMLRAELSPYWENTKLLASINQIFISSVHVPLPYSKKINEIVRFGQKNNQYIARAKKPRYQIELKVGKRLEPWIDRVKQL